jgi:hypothetical protein
VCIEDNNLEHILYYLWPPILLKITLYCEVLTNLVLKIEMPKIIVITDRSFYHLATTTNSSASQRRATALAPPSPEPANLVVILLVVTNRRDVVELRP